MPRAQLQGQGVVYKLFVYNCPTPEKRLTDPEPKTQIKGIPLDLEIPRHTLGNED